MPISEPCMNCGLFNGKHKARCPATPGDSDTKGEPERTLPKCERCGDRGYYPCPTCSGEHDHGYISCDHDQEFQSTDQEGNALKGCTCHSSNGAMVYGYHGRDWSKPKRNPPAEASEGRELHEFMAPKRGFKCRRCGLAESNSWFHNQPTNPDASGEPGVCPVDHGLGFKCEHGGGIGHGGNHYMAADEEEETPRLEWDGPNEHGNLTPVPQPPGRLLTDEQQDAVIDKLPPEQESVVQPLLMAQDAQTAAERDAYWQAKVDAAEQRLATYKIEFDKMYHEASDALEMGAKADEERDAAQEQIKQMVPALELCAEQLEAHDAIALDPKCTQSCCVSLAGAKEARAALAGNTGEQESTGE